MTPLPRQICHWSCLHLKDVHVVSKRILGQNGKKRCRIKLNYTRCKEILSINAVAFEKYVSDSSQKNQFFPDGIKVKSDV